MQNRKAVTSKMAKLCVNIDHVATLRQARLDIAPDPVEAAAIVEKAGAIGITVHLREDRRHINDTDVMRLKKCVKKKLNLEMSTAKDVVALALKVVPDEATLVPEKRRELTTEGGLDVIGNFGRIREVITALKRKNIIVSLFIEPSFDQISAAKEAGADFIEIHTGSYSNNFGKKSGKTELKKIKKAVCFASALGLKVNAGHGLTYANVGAIAAIKEIEDLNIGHNIVAKAVLYGMEKAVKEMIKAIK
jgi:pyridoxine 5-phosphate synthase